MEFKYDVRQNSKYVWSVLLWDGCSWQLWRQGAKSDINAAIAAFTEDFQQKWIARYA